MDKSYFDVSIDRTEKSNTYSAKWMSMDIRYPEFDVEGVLPMWVADMDFRCPPEVIEAVKLRAAHGIYGYTDGGLVEKFIDSAVAWLERRHGWKVDASECFFTPGVIPVINAAVQEFTDPGDGVIIQSPVYYPFTDGPVNNGRVLKHNCLIEAQPGYYVMDYENLEELASDPRTKLLILSNPHNPVGRVWTADELRRMCEICIRHDVVIVSDEIHADLIMSGHTHIPTGSISDEIANHVISCYAPSKTFNLAGLGVSMSVVKNEEMRKRIQKRILANRIPSSNVFGPLAGDVAYRTGDSYVDELVKYVESNMDYVLNFLKENTPLIHARKSEGTYMLWLDLRDLKLGTDESNAFLIRDCKVAGDFGIWFGMGGEGFTRLNLACPRSYVEDAMSRIKKGYDKLSLS